MVAFAASSTTKLTCTNCGTIHTVPVETEMSGDEIIGVAELETVPCEGSDDCSTRLCSHCAVACTECLLTSCGKHLQDGVCEICRKQAKEQAESGCPQCGSHDIYVIEYDFGISADTGYHDAGCRWTCHSCGDEGDNTNQLTGIKPKKAPAGAAGRNTAESSAA